MLPGYRTIISVETSPIGAHRTVVAALEGLPGAMPGAPKSARAAPRGARTGPDGRARPPACYLTRGPPGSGRLVRKTGEVGPGLGEDRGEPRRPTGRVAEAPVGEPLVSAGLIWFPDLVGELGTGGADVDGGATGPPVPASRPARRIRKKRVPGATLTSARPRRIPYHCPGPRAPRPWVVVAEMRPIRTISADSRGAARSPRAHVFRNDIKPRPRSREQHSRGGLLEIDVITMRLERTRAGRPSRSTRLRR